jgi:flagellum-specific peptidoglycan hydrolase FlgJ
MNAELSLTRCLKFATDYWFQVSLCLLCLLAITKRFWDSENSNSRNRSAVSKLQPALRTVTANPGNEVSFKFFGKNENAGISIVSLKADEVTVRKFINRFKKVAITEQKKFGIPASVILATSIYVSHSGTGSSVAESKNYFGLRCEYGKLGMCPAGFGGALRTYGTAWESFRDFSLFASEYFSKIKGQDRTTWIKALYDSGYCSDKTFTTNLEEIITLFRLYELDKQR